jgi:hypothetical protein
MAPVMGPIANVQSLTSDANTTGAVESKFRGETMFPLRSANPASRQGLLCAVNFRRRSPASDGEQPAKRRAPTLLEGWSGAWHHAGLSAERAI